MTFLAIGGNGRMAAREAAAAVPAATAAPPAMFGTRHIQAFMTFLCFVQAYVVVSCMSVAIVAMADDPELNWSSEHQSVVMSAFLWGFCVSPMLGGRLALVFGAKNVLLSSIALSTVGSFVLPLAAQKGGWEAACAVRVMQGLFQGPLAPATHALLSKWVPPSERSRLGSFVYGGAQFGTVIGLLFTGILTDKLGWPSVFYGAGILGVLWTLAWLYLGADTPVAHPRIDPQERDYIKEQVSANASLAKVVSTPWRVVLTSAPVWGLTAAHCGQMVGYWTLLTQLPNYMKNVQQYAIMDNGMVSALPYFTMWLAALPLSFISDALIKSGKLNTTAMRKIANTIAQWGGAIMLGVIGTGVSDSSHVLTIVLLTCSMTLLSAMYLGFQINHLDLSPNHAPALMGFTNLWANLLSVLGPLITPLIVTRPTDPAQWHVVFYSAAAVFLVANTLFLLFGTAETQPWNTLGLETKEDLESNMQTNISTITLSGDALKGGLKHVS
ncbi:putative inorganic phosphate cotransporter [Thrips palmi]|uniref:Inorganic phosphate cotransporter n=1 Tax=Thrips palmi TaxID=161013 RepID=A0A6P8ZLW3_THRPL|nr:putative inorganic phosphate cotransporter [Thrips palmi]